MTLLKDTEDAFRYLTQRVEILAAHLDGFDIGHETFRQFSCTEIEALADVLRTAGCPETADQVIVWHAEGDEPGDSHFIIPADAKCNECGAQGDITLSEDWGYVCPKHVEGPS